MSQDDETRHSVADIPAITTKPDEIERIEVANGLRQFDLARRVIEDFVNQDLERDRIFRLRPSLILQLQGEAVKGLTSYSGVFRPGSVQIGKSSHQPPDAVSVPGLVEEFCDTINDNFKTATAIRLAAYALWRLNWIHPFVDGNGRTSRIVSHIVLNIRLGYLVPGQPTVPELIAENKFSYYSALETADKSYETGKTTFAEIDVSAVEQLIAAHFSTQLLSVAKAAGIPIDGS